MAVTIAFATPRNAEPASSPPREPPDPLAILSSVGEAVYDWDLLTDALRWSPDAARLLGVDDLEGFVTGRGFHAMTAGASAYTRRDAILGGDRSDTGNGVAYQIRYGLQTGDTRRIVWIDDTGRWFAGAAGVRPGRTVSCASRRRDARGTKTPCSPTSIRSPAARRGRGCSARSDRCSSPGACARDSAFSSSASRTCRR